MGQGSQTPTPAEGADNRTRSPRGSLAFSRAGEIAQLVEHTTENRGVPGSSPGLAIHERAWQTQIGGAPRYGRAWRSYASTTASLPFRRSPGRNSTLAS